MDGIKIDVIGNVAKVIKKPSRITSGTVGLPIEYTFDEQWDGLTKVAVFRGGAIEKSVDLVADLVVPWEVLLVPGVWLSVGVYGANEDGSVAIPTIWANVLPISVGVDPEGDPSIDPTLPIWADVLKRIADVYTELAKYDTTYAVLYIEQALSEAQKAQTRKNIGTAGISNAENGSEVFNTYDGEGSNVAISPYSHAEGGGNVAGTMAFIIEACVVGGTDTETGTTEATFTLDAVDELVVGDEISIKCGSSYPKLGVITEIVDNTIKIVSTERAYLEELATKDYPHIETKHLYIIGKPRVGSVSFEAYQHAEGSANTALLWGAHAEGYGNLAADRYAHAEGRETVAYYAAHAEGRATLAQGFHSHSEGFRTQALGESSHAENGYTTASGFYSHAEGESTIASGDNSHAEGNKSKSVGKNSHAEGYGGLSEGENSHSEGQATQAIGKNSHAEGQATQARGKNSHAEGESTTAYSNFSHAEGNGTTASGEASHAEGISTKATASWSHAEGGNTKATGIYAHSEGEGTAADGPRSHAEGCNTQATAFAAHAEGHDTIASGDESHAEGNATKASGKNAHAEGYGTLTEGENAHAEGASTSASGKNTHAEGYNSVAEGYTSHAEGFGTLAKGNFSHAGGDHTIASAKSQTAIGQYNATNDEALFIVGNGSSEDARSNAFAVNKDGSACVGVTGETDNSIVNLGYVKKNIPWILDETTQCFYRTVDGEKEWMNPPMTVLYDGVSFNEDGSVVGEYRTSERYCGQPVYTCIIDTGAGVSGSSAEKTTNVRFESNPKVVRFSGFAVNPTTTEGRAIPYVERITSDARTYWAVNIARTDENNMVIVERSHLGRSEWNVYFQMWYTKALPTWAIATTVTE